MRRVKERVPLDECVRRAVDYYRAHYRDGELLPASVFAPFIWPGAEFRSAQGAGAAASRVLKEAQGRGLARWGTTYSGASGRPVRWGWQILSKKAVGKAGA